MSVSRELLMRFHDGAVSEAEARLVEEALEIEPALLEELEAYSELGSFVRVWAEANTDKQIDIADSVMSALEPSKPSARVHPRCCRASPPGCRWVRLSLRAPCSSRALGLRHRLSLAARTLRGRPIKRRCSSGQQQRRLEVSAAPRKSPRRRPRPSSPWISARTPGSVFVVSTDSSETPVVWMPDDAEPDEDNEDRSESL